MSSDDETPGWAAPEEPGTFIPPSWQAPVTQEPEARPALDLTLHPAGPVGGGRGSSTLPAGNTAGPLGSIVAGVVGQTPKQKRGCLRKIMIAIAVFIVLFTALGIWVFKSTAGAEKEAHAFVNEVVAGEADAAYARTAGSFREKFSKLDFTTGVESNHAEFGDAKISNVGRFISSKTGCPSRAVMTYRLLSGSSRNTSKRPTTSYARIVLQKVGGAWKVIDPSFTASEPSTDLADGEGC